MHYIYSAWYIFRPIMFSAGRESACISKVQLNSFNFPFIMPLLQVKKWPRGFSSDLCGKHLKIWPTKYHINSLMWTWCPDPCLKEWSSFNFCYISLNSHKLFFSPSWFFTFINVVVVVLCLLLVWKNIPETKVLSVCHCDKSWRFTQVNALKDRDCIVVCWDLVLAPQT